MGTIKLSGTNGTVSLVDGNPTGEVFLTLPNESGTLVVNPASANTVYGLIYNKTADTYKRFGTGTYEDNVWLSVQASRMNDDSNTDAVTMFFNSPYTVQGQMKRVVVNSSGAEVKDYLADNYAHPHQTGLLATEQVMVKIPKFHYISIEFTHNSNVYNLYAQGLSSFSIDLASHGFSGATSIQGQKVNVYESYGTITGTVITSVVHSAFKHSNGIDRSFCYLGAFDAVSGRSTCTTTGTATPVQATVSITFPTARTQAKNFGTGFGIQSYFMREALQVTALIERGSFMLERTGASANNKWEAYSWRSGATSNDQNNGLTLPLGNNTGVIKNASGQTIANSYRGVENYTGHLWQMVDGINSISGVLWMAVWGSTYASDTTASPYFNSGITILTNMSSSYITDIFKGTFIPKTVGGSTISNMTDGAWSASGNGVLYVGGNQDTPSFSGLVCWTSSAASSYSNWNFGSRSASLSAS